MVTTDTPWTRNVTQCDTQCICNGVYINDYPCRNRRVCVGMPSKQLFVSCEPVTMRVARWLYRSVATSIPASGSLEVDGQCDHRVIARNQSTAVHEWGRGLLPYAYRMVWATGSSP